MKEYNIFRSVFLYLSPLLHLLHQTLLIEQLTINMIYLNTPAHCTDAPVRFSRRTKANPLWASFPGTRVPSPG